MKENLYDELYTEQEEQVDYKALFFKYLIHWKWFVASIVVCLIGGWIYLHYTTPVYSITGSVIIKDNKKNNSVSTGLADLEDLGFYSSTNNFDNEVEVLHSRTLLKKVVEELDLYINYRTRENLRNFWLRALQYMIRCMRQELSLVQKVKRQKNCPMAQQCLKWY
jgi:tyrosine-protein kinase Etk/Wzc